MSASTAPGQGTAQGRATPRVPQDAIVVTDRRAFVRSVTAPVVPAAAWARLSELDSLLDQVNALYAQAEKEVAKAREEGHSAGFSEGLARAQQQMTGKMAELNERRARVLAEAAGRITDLACAIVARIAPGFDALTVVPPLVMQAVEAAQAEQFLLIRVHPDVRERVEAGLGAVRQAHPAVGVIELVADESLDPLSCVVVSEAGEVRAGVTQQIEAIRAALAGAAAEAAPS
ncbi:FliH/SctL family protein [Luteimonas sp. A478]